MTPDHKFDPSMGLAEAKLDERNLDRTGMRLRNVRRALIDACGFGARNYGDTDQRSMIDSVMNNQLSEITAWLTDGLMNIATVAWVLTQPELATQILCGRVVIGAVTGLRREAQYASAREEILRTGIRGAGKKNMKLFSESLESGGLGLSPSTSKQQGAS